jgi:hypothetical protein
VGPQLQVCGGVLVEQLVVLAHWPCVLHVCSQLLLQSIPPGAQAPVHVAPPPFCTHVWLVALQFVESTQLPDASHVCTLLVPASHFVCPGAQTPAHAPLTQVWFEQAVVDPHCPLTQVCTLLPWHRVAPAVHVPPVHAPFVQVSLPAQATGPSQLPVLGSQVSVCVASSHFVALGSHTPQTPAPAQIEPVHGVTIQVPELEHCSLSMVSAHCLVPVVHMPLHVPALHW